MKSVQEELRRKASSVALVYGEYKPHAMNEAISDMGDKIICKHCGEVKYRKRYSSLAGAYIWDDVQRDAKGSIVKQGCSCVHKNILHKQDRQEAYRKAHGKPIEYDWYSLNRHMQSVKFPGAGISNRFYMQHYTEGVVIVRDYICYWDQGGMDGDYYFQGEPGTYKTSLMCCIQFCMIKRASPCLISTPSQLAIDFKYQNHLDELYAVDVLIIDDVGLLRINDKLSKEIEDMLRKRKSRGGFTLIASRYSPDSLATRGYSSSLINYIKDSMSTPIILEGASAYEPA